MADFIPLLLFLFGLCVGSFVNVLTFRFGFAESRAPRSHCMACENEIAWYDLVPVLSYVALSGRCRSCGSALSVQYPIVELATGALFLGAFLATPPLPALPSIIAFAALLGFLAALVGLIAYDIRHLLVPMPFVYALIAFAACADLAQSLSIGSFTPLFEGAIGGAALFIFFYAIVLLTRGRGMGAGDAYVAGAIGLLLGPFRGAEAAMMGIWGGTLIALFLLFFAARLFPRAPRVTLKTALPLAPFLGGGALIAILTAFSPLSLVSSAVSLLFFRNP